MRREDIKSLFLEERSASAKRLEVESLQSFAFLMWHEFWYTYTVLLWVMSKDIHG